MNLETGKTYRMRDGRVATILSTTARGNLPCIGVVHEATRDAPFAWTRSGHRINSADKNQNFESKSDIVEFICGREIMRARGVLGE